MYAATSRPPSASSTRPSPRESRDRRSLDGQYLRQHGRRGPGRGVPSRPGRRVSSATTTRPNTWPTARPRSGSRPVHRSSWSCRGRHTGPAIHSAVGAQLKAAFDGTARYLAQTDLGISPTYVDDLAAGIVAALDRGRLGQAYVMCGINMRLGEAVAIAAEAGGRRLPQLTIPSGLLRLAARLAPGGGLWSARGRPARDRPRIGWRDVLGQSREGDGRARLHPARACHRSTRRVRARVGPSAGSSYTPAMARDLPMLDLSRGRSRPPGRAAIDRAGRVVGPANPPPTAPRRCAATRTGSARGCRRGENYHELKGLLRGLSLEHGLRGGPLPEHREVLGPADRHDHDPRRHLHPGLRLLRGQDRPADLVR